MAFTHNEIETIEEERREEKKVSSSSSSNDKIEFNYLNKKLNEI